MRSESLARPRQHLAHHRHRRRDRRQLLERGSGHARDDARERRLAAARRAVEDHRADAVLLDREPQGRAFAEHVFLADELVERRRPHAQCERRDDAGALARSVGEEIAHGNGKYAPAHGDRRRGGLFAADPPGPRRERLRALSAHRRPARSAEDARGDGAPRRAPLPDGASVVGALAQARVLRGGDGDRGAARARIRPPRSVCSAVRATA